MPGRETSSRADGSNIDTASRAKGSNTGSPAPRAWLGVALVLTLGGCSSLQPKQAEARPAGFASGGRPLRVVPAFSGALREDAIVRIVGPVACTGTLIAEDLVLTAHHCVTQRDVNGRSITKDVAPGELSVELGGGDLPWAEVGVRAVLAPDCGYISGEGDIAILVLSRRLVGMSTMTPRLDAPPAKGESILATGFGKCWASPGSVLREHRRSLKIEHVAAGLFDAETAICPGDSGGPVRRWEGDEPGEVVVGVVSASVMDGDAGSLGRSYFTRLDRWRPLFAAARAVAEGASASEVPPFRSCLERE